MGCSGVVAHSLSDVQVVDSTLEHRYLSHHSASVFSKLRSLWRNDQGTRLSSLPAVVHSASYPPGKANRVAAYPW